MGSFVWGSVSLIPLLRKSAVTSMKGTDVDDCDGENLREERAPWLGLTKSKIYLSSSLQENLIGSLD